MWITTKLVFLLLFDSLYSKTTCSKGQNLVFVNSEYKFKTCKNIENTVNCTTIDQALSLPSLTNVCITIENNQTLHNITRLNGVENFSLLAKDSEISISCMPNAGILALNSTGILFANLTVRNCGALVNEYAHNHTTIQIFTAFYFRNNQDMTFNNVNITKSKGYGMILNNCIGNIAFAGVAFEKNSAILPPHSQPGFTSGGGLLISNGEFINTTFKFTQCVFKENIGERNNTPLVSYNEGDVPFGRGAGLAVFFHGTTSENTVVIKNCLFDSNKGLWGGALLIMFENESQNNLVTVKDSQFLSNRAKMHGGGVRVVSSRMGSSHSNQLRFARCLFKNNAAVFGGGVSHYRTYFTEQSVTWFENCTFTHNSAEMGSAVYMARVTIVFKNLFCNENWLRWGYTETVGRGTVYAYNAQLVFYDNNKLSDNKNTAFILDFTYVKIMEYGVLSLIGNKGSMGGAFEMYEFSIIFLKDYAKLVFTNNTGYRSGAVYAKSTRPFSLLPTFIEDCFIKRKASSELEYDNNMASVEGLLTDIFTTTLVPCQPDLGPLNTTKIVTDPIHIKINKTDWMNVYPGQMFTPSVILLDEMNNTVSRTVNVFANTMESMLSLYVKENKILIELVGKKSEKFEISVSFKDLKVTMKNLSFQDCKFGHIFKKDRCICDQMKNIINGLVCNDDGTVSLFAGLYVNFKQQRTGKAAKTHVCPYGYCRPCKNLTCTFGEHNQCAANRSGYLCSQCAEGMTVELGGEGCLASCSYYDLFYIPLIILIIFMLVLLAMILLNICIFYTWLNSFIYFYQVMKYHTTMSEMLDRTFVNDVVHNIIIFRGFHFGDSSLNMCVVKQWNDLDKMFFNYLIPTVMIISVIIVNRCSLLYKFAVKMNVKWKNLFSKDEHNEATTNFYNLYILIGVLAYGDLTRITLNLLHPVLDEKNQLLLYIYASAQFFQGRHLPYGIVAIFVLIFVVLLWPIVLVTAPFTSSQLFSSWFPIFAEFQSTLHCGRHWFASFYFFSRFVIIGFGIFVEDKLYQLTVVTLVSTLVMLTFLMCWPYRNQSSNYFDAYILFLLVLIGTMSDGKFGLQTDKFDRFFFDTTKVLMYLPFVIVLRWVYCVYQFVKNKKDRHNMLAAR